MADGATANFGFIKPEVDSENNEDAWASPSNSNWDKFDAIAEGVGGRYSGKGGASAMAGSYPDTALIPYGTANQWLSYQFGQGGIDSPDITMISATDFYSPKSDMSLEWRILAHTGIPPSAGSGSPSLHFKTRLFNTSDDLAESEGMACFSTRPSGTTSQQSYISLVSSGVGIIRKNKSYRLQTYHRKVTLGANELAPIWEYFPLMSVVQAIGDNFGSLLIFRRL